MEVALIIGLFATSALSLNAMVNQRTKTAGAMTIVNMCLTVAVAYQFKQIQNIVWVFAGLAAIVIAYFIVKTYFKKKKHNKANEVVDVELIEEKDK